MFFSAAFMRSAGTIRGTGFREPGSVAVYRTLALCRRIRHLRVTAEYTQFDVAEKLGISQAAYSRLETGEVDITITKLIDLAELYGMSLMTITEGL
jgi:DNA-binding XRE family transcriptional regulator